MRKIKLVALLLLISTLASAQSWQPNNTRTRMAAGLGIPVKDSSSFNRLADSALIYINPNDTTGLYWKYKGSHKKVGAGSSDLQITTDAGNITTNNLVVNSGLGDRVIHSSSSIEFEKTGTGNQIAVSAPAITANREAYLQDASGTIAYLSDIPAGISGLTTNYIPKATSATTIGNSIIYEDGTNVGIGTASPTAPLNISQPAEVSPTANLLKITGNTTGGYGLRDILTLSAQGDVTLQNRNGHNILGHNATAGTVSYGNAYSDAYFYSAQSIFSGGILGFTGGSYLRGSDWTSNLISPNNAWGMLYQTTGGAGASPTGHVFTTSSAMDAAQPIFTVKNAGPALVTVNGNGSMETRGSVTAGQPYAAGATGFRMYTTDLAYSDWSFMNRVNGAGMALYLADNGNYGLKIDADGSFGLGWRGYQGNTLRGSAYGYNVGVGMADYAAPDNSAKFEVRSSSLGFLQPRLTQSEMDAVASPTEGLQVYNSTVSKNFVFSDVAGLGSPEWFSNTTPEIYTVGFASYNPGDAQTHFFSNVQSAPINSDTHRKIYFRDSGYISYAQIWVTCNSTVGTSEDWSIYIRRNGVDDFLIATVSAATQDRLFENTGLGLSIAKDDYIELMIVNPTWATNPVSVVAGGHLKFYTK